MTTMILRSSFAATTTTVLLKTGASIDMITRISFKTILLLAASFVATEAFHLMTRLQSRATIITTPTPRRMSDANDNNTEFLNKETTEKALFGMGCFWNPQEEFHRMDGVVSATCGYASVLDNNSDSTPPSYLSVCSGDGRTEAVLVEYLPSVVSYSQLLKTFWQNHDASTAEKPQYQSVLWPMNDEQRTVAVQDVERATQAYQEQGMNPPRTIVVASTTPKFVAAESIHQNFWTKLRFKLACLACATLFTTTSQTLVVDPLVTTIATKLILLWVVWEVSESKQLSVFPPASFLT